MDNKLTLYVISQTHWDREWYQTFQSFRKRLVYMVDELLDHMEKDPDYKYFHMDGQTIVLEDYLQIRPENEARLRKLIQEGRIIIGPWYVMPDEFLVSGESLVRNFQKGFAISRSYGVEPLKNGYVVDIFGHNSQFPQILKGFGMDAATLYRGIGEYPKDVFTWEAVDGSQVLAMKLDRERSYSNFYFAIRWPFDHKGYEKDELVERMKQLLDFSGNLAVSKNMLMMDGVDHIEIEPKLTEILKILNENMDTIEIKHATLQEYYEAQKNSGAQLDVLRGELYSLGKRGVNNQVLKNVLSSMVHLKQANTESEILLTRWAEPFDAALSYIKPVNNKGFLELAWKYLLQNHPHDSICGCSITRVHKDNEYRFHQAQDLAQEVIQMDFQGITKAINSAKMPGDYCIHLFNGGQKDYAGVVEAEIWFAAGSTGNFKLYDAEGGEIPYQVLDVRKGVTKGVFEFRRLPQFPSVDIYKVAFEAAIPAVGYRTFGYKQFHSKHPGFGEYTFNEFYAPTRYLGTHQTDVNTWENEYLKISINGNGSLLVTHKETGKVYDQWLVFEDCGDVGDGWNYRKPAMDVKHISTSSRCEVAVEKDGPLETVLKVMHYMRLPESSVDGFTRRSAEMKDLQIVTYITLRKGSRKLEFRTEINNNITDHRIRVLFPTHMKTDTYYASTPYYLQQRNIQRADWSDYVEADTGVSPNQGVVVVKDGTAALGIYNKGLYEVEVTEDSSHTVALTLFRSFRNEVGVGPYSEMGVMLKPMVFEYAVEVAKPEVHEGSLMIEGDMWRTGTRSICAFKNEGMLEESASFLRVNVPCAVLSAFKTANHGLKVIRLYNCTQEFTKGTVELYEAPGKVYTLNLNEEIQEERTFEGRNIVVELRPGQILSLGVR